MFGEAKRALQLLVLRNRLSTI